MPYCKCINNGYLKYDYIQIGNVYEYTIEYEYHYHSYSDQKTPYNVYCIRSVSDTNEVNYTRMFHYEFSYNFKILNRKEKLERILNYAIL